MNQMIKFMISFSVGVGVGYGLTYIKLRRRYNNAAKELQEYYNNLTETEPEEQKDISPEPINKREKEDLQVHYSSIVKAQEYTQDKTFEKGSGIHVVNPDDQDYYEDYALVNLVYYADNVLVDTDGDILDGEDIEEMITSEALTHFGEYEEDTVLVRNDNAGIYYQIIREEETYGISAGPQIEED